MKSIIVKSIVVILLCILILSLRTSANTFSIEQYYDLIEDQQEIKRLAHETAENARKLGWDEDSELIRELQRRWREADNAEFLYNKAIQGLLNTKSKQMEEYPVATEVWYFMKSLGWNDAVCAGIMGNMMAEVGGQTLNLQPLLYSSSGSYYGICQWNIFGYPEVNGVNLQKQCIVLRDTIEREFKVFGYKYQSGFTFEDFLNLQDPSQASLAFSKCYERCNSKYHEIRQVNAVKAYKYFTGN